MRETRGARDLPYLCAVYWHLVVDQIQAEEMMIDHKSIGSVKPDAALSVIVSCLVVEASAGFK